MSFPLCHRARPMPQDDERMKHLFIIIIQPIIKYHYIIHKKILSNPSHRTWIIKKKKMYRRHFKQTLDWGKTVEKRMYGFIKRQRSVKRKEFFCISVFFSFIFQFLCKYWMCVFVFFPLFVLHHCLSLGSQVVFENQRQRERKRKENTNVSE